LAEVKNHLRGGETAGFGDCDEDAEEAEVEVRDADYCYAGRSASNSVGEYMSKLSKIARCPKAFMLLGEMENPSFVSRIKSPQKRSSE
jgi:hypothetical protein